jgi:hypothetical protein
VTTPELDRLAQGLKDLRRGAGTPTYEAIRARARQARYDVAKSALCTADKGTTMPTWPVTAAYVVGCHGDPKEWYERWKAAHAAHTRSSAAAPVPSPIPVGDPPDPAGATTAQELRRALRMVHEWAGSPSSATIARTAAAQELRLSRSTVQHLLSDKRDALPRQESLTALLTVLGVNADAREQWLRIRAEIDHGRRRSAADPHDTPPSPPARHRWWRWTLRPVAILLATGILAATVLRADSIQPDVATPRHPTPTGLAARPGEQVPLTLQYVDAAPPASPRLISLVDRLRTQTGPEAAGRYTVVHSRRFSRDVTSAASPPDTRLTEERLWRAADGSGRRITTILGPAPGPSSAQPVAASPSPATVEDYPPGQLRTVVEEPASVDFILAGQLSDHNSFANGPHAPIRAIADLNDDHCLTPAVRAAALRVLADTSGLLDRGMVTDRAGRHGFAVSVDTDAGSTRDIAVIDADTGQLLSYERVALVQHPPGIVHPPTVVAFTVYLDCARSDQLGHV